MTSGFFCRSEPAAALRGLANARCSASLEPLVQRLEGLHRQEDLAADLDHGRRIVDREPLRHALDGSDVGGDVLADAAVAARRGLDEPPALVGERARDAVDLQLADEAAPVPDAALDPGPPRVQLFDAERVVEREHRRPVLDRREQRRPARRPPAAWASRG